MKQKLALSCALIHRPKVLFLDEPTTGVDAVSRREFWGLLHQMRAAGLTILVSTPYMDEAMRCDRIALMQHGTILLEDYPQNLSKNFPSRVFSIKVTHKYNALKCLREWPAAHNVYVFGEFLHLIGKSETINEHNIHDFLYENGFSASVYLIEAHIEDVFIHLSETN